MCIDESGWFKSSYSGQNGNCVEARRHADGIQIRDSKATLGPTLSVPAAPWSAFIRLVSAEHG